MKHLRKLSVSLILAMATSGCLSTLQTLGNVSQVYTNAKAGTQLYNSNKMVKSMKDAEPIFEEFRSVKIETLISPRDEKNAANIVTAFKDNFEYIVERDLAELKTGKSVCKDDCDGNTMLIQFKENGYDESLAQKLLTGEKLRGKLYFIDKTKGSVIKEESFETLNTYNDILSMVHVSVATKLIKSVKDGKAQKEAMDKLNQIDPIKPEYKTLFEKS